MDAQAFRAQFELDSSLIYLNAGTHSLCPRRVTDRHIQNIRDYERNPTHGVVESYSRMWNIQKQLGAFLKARPEDLLLRSNATSAMNTMLLGVALGTATPRGEILVSDAEYGATVNICRLRAERDGLKLRTFHLPGTSAELAGITETGLAEQIIRELGPETRLVMLSHVITGNGLKLPIELIARETRKRGIILAVDGAHATGALPLDFGQWGDVDLYAGNLHKWVMGPKGTGYGWVHPSHQAGLKPLEAGWMTFEVNAAHAKFAPGHGFAQKFYDSSCYDFAPFFALEEVFSVWHEWGPDEIRARLGALQSCVELEMKSKTGWQCLTPSDTHLRGPLLAYELPEKLKAEGYELMHRLLREQRIQISSSYLQNRWVLRISPHVHNTEAEIALAAGALAGL